MTTHHETWIDTKAIQDEQSRDAEENQVCDECKAEVFDGGCWCDECRKEYK